MEDEPMRTQERIAGRLVEIDVGKVEGVGWVAVGVVRGGLRHEVGMLFEARGSDSSDATVRLALEIEVHFD